MEQNRSKGYTEGKVEIERVENGRTGRAKEFIELPFKLYENNGYWVPPFKAEVAEILERRHPFFEHSEGDFFIARRNGKTIGRIAVFNNNQYNNYRSTREAHFYFFDCYEDEEAARALFDRIKEWSKKRGLNRVVGPRGFSAMNGGGILIDGFQYRAAMTMMNYNFPYYKNLVESNGFSKLKDFYSALLDNKKYHVPEKIRRVVEISKKRGTFRVPRFRKKSELKKIAQDIGRVYNEAFTSHDDFCPLTTKEIKLLTNNLLLVSKPELMKILYYRDEIAGFLFAFPDLSAALQRAKGKLNLFSMIDIMRESRKTEWLIINGAGILPKYQKLGGNALLYYELEKTVKSSGLRYLYSDLTQIAESTTLMLKDLETLGSRIYKTHRVYQCSL